MMVCKEAALEININNPQIKLVLKIKKINFNVIRKSFIHEKRVYIHRKR